VRSQQATDTLTAYKDVGDHAALARAGLFVAEGRLVVERLLEDPRIRVHSVLVTPPAARALGALLERRTDVETIVREPEALQAITGFDFHRGCLALAWRDGLGAAPLDRIAGGACVLALEGIGNPDNVGGLFRTAFALGTDAILLDPSTADPLYRKAIRTSMGAALRLPYRRAEAWPDELAALRTRGFTLVALTPAADAMTLDDSIAQRAGRIVLMLGSEGAGLSPHAVAHADLRVRVPIDPRADSLNVTVAAGIVLNALKTSRVTHE
jgi:tRNA G18 (ribose-2'-O)-methylase SpoU